MKNTNSATDAYREAVQLLINQATAEILDHRDKETAKNLYRKAASLSLIDSKYDDLLFEAVHKLKSLSHNKNSELETSEDLKTAEEATLNLEKDTRLQRTMNKFQGKPQLIDYCHSLQSELIARHTAALALQSNKLDISNKGHEEFADDAGSIISSFVPILGGLVNVAARNIGKAHDSYYGQKELNALGRIVGIFPSHSSFEKFAIGVSVKLTEKYETELLELDNSPLTTDNNKTSWEKWKSGMNSFIENYKDSHNVIASITKLIKEKETGATLLGRVHSDNILSYLEEKQVAYDLKHTSAENPGKSNEVRKGSIIVNKVIASFMGQGTSDEDIIEAEIRTTTQNNATDVEETLSQDSTTESRKGSEQNITRLIEQKAGEEEVESATHNSAADMAITFTDNNIEKSSSSASIERKTSDEETESAPQSNTDILMTFTDNNIERPSSSTDSSRRSAKQIVTESSNSLTQFKN